MIVGTVLIAKRKIFTDQCLRERRQRSRRAQGQFERLSGATLEVGSLSADTSVLSIFFLKEKEIVEHNGIESDNAR